MESFYRRGIQRLLIPSVFVLIAILSACGDDEPAPTPDPPLASFSTSIDNLTVVFTNNSTNAVSASWNFGDGNVSTDANPTHTYASGGTYTVVLTVTSEDGETDDFQENVSVLEDPAQFIHGGSSREWKLVRQGTAMLLASDSDFTQVWWSGSSNNGERPCMYDDSFTFGSDGSYTYNDAGTFWAEFG
ncbi:MAG: PKD domain-containing protein, partial [Bacteroidota bacterium]